MCVLIGFLQKILEIPIMNPLSWFMMGVKITFFVFLSIYSQGGTMASWAAQHTTVCLSFMLLYNYIPFYNFIMLE